MAPFGLHQIVDLMKGKNALLNEQVQIVEKSIYNLEPKNRAVTPNKGLLEKELEFNRELRHLSNRAFPLMHMEELVIFHQLNDHYITIDFNTPLEDHVSRFSTNIAIGEDTVRRVAGLLGHHEVFLKHRFKNIYPKSWQTQYLSLYVDARLVAESFFYLLKGQNLHTVINIDSPLEIWDLKTRTLDSYHCYHLSDSLFDITQTAVKFINWLESMLFENQNTGGGVVLKDEQTLRLLEDLKIFNLRAQKLQETALIFHETINSEVIQIFREKLKRLPDD
jgi:hypothetical protein